MVFSWNEIIYGFPFIHKSEKMHMVFRNTTWFPKPWIKDKERKIRFRNMVFYRGCGFVKTKDRIWFKEINSKLQEFDNSKVNVEKFESFVYEIKEISTSNSLT